MSRNKNGLSFVEGWECSWKLTLNSSEVYSFIIELVSWFFLELILGQQELMFRFSGSAVVRLNTTLTNVRRGITLFVSNYKMISQALNIFKLRLVDHEIDRVFSSWLPIVVRQRAFFHNEDRFFASRGICSWCFIGSYPVWIYSPFPVGTLLR